MKYTDLRAGNLVKSVLYEFDKLKSQYKKNEFCFYQHVTGNIIAIVHDNNDTYSDPDFAQLQFALISKINKSYPDFDVFFLNVKDLHLYPGLILFTDLLNDFESYVHAGD